MFKQSILSMKPYHPPLEGRRKVAAQGGFLLDFNERVGTLPEFLQKALSQEKLVNLLQAYPEYGNIEEQIASYAEVPSEQVMITNGSDQGIDVLIRSCCYPNSEVIIPKPSFAMFFQSAAVEGCRVISPAYVDQGERFAYPTEAVLEAINEKTSLITICTPNNPTGDALAIDEILQIAKAAPKAAILVDECYFEYSKITVKDHLESHPNLFITRSFSKTFGLPSLRLGYLMSQAKNLEQLLKVRGPYDVNMAAVTVVAEALKEPEYLRNYVAEVMEVKENIYHFLREENFKFWQSDANFILLRPPVGDANQLEEFLRTKSILTRPRSGPGIDNTLRITIPGRTGEAELISALKDFLHYSNTTHH